MEQITINTNANLQGGDGIEKLHAFLLKLSDALQLLDNPVHIEEAATQIALEFMEADRCHYGTIEGDNIIILHDAVRGNLPSVAGVHAISSFILYKAALKGGVPFVVDNVSSSDKIDEELKKMCLLYKYGSFINVPVVKSGKAVGLLSLIQSKPRKWTTAEVQLTIETAERTWAAVERAKAEDALHKSEEKYHTLFASIDQGFTLCELIRNKEGKGIDFYMLEVNPTYEKQTGVSKEMVLGKAILQVFPSLEKWIETYAAVVDNHCPVVFEHYFEDTDRWFAIKAYPVEKDRFAVLFSNITERKNAEEKLKESESRFRTMADASPLLIWTIDANGLPSYYNKTFLGFVGVTKDEDISVWQKIIHPDDIQSTFETINAAIAARRSYSLECRLLRADGQWRYVIAQGNPCIGSNSEFLGFVGSSVDITERKQAEEKIKESEHRFHELIYSSPSMMAILKGEDMIIEIANDAVLASWGKGKDIIGKSLFSVLPEAVEQGFDKLLLNVYKTGDPFYAYETPVTLLRNAINEIIYYNFIYQAQRNLNGEIEGVGILANEVTPQALVNKKIKASEEKFKRLVLHAPVAICVLRGQDYVIETMNEAMCAFWDRTLTQALNKPVFDVIPEAKDQGIKELLDNVYFTGERCVIQELSVDIMRNGKLENAFIKFVYEPLREADGTVSGVMALAHEITEQVVARKKVEESEKKFEAAIVAVEGIIWTNNANGEMVGEQPGWAKLTGQHFEEYQDYGWTKAIHPDDAQPTVDAWNQAVATNSTFEFEHRVKTAQNEWRLFAVKAVPAFDKNGAIQQWVGVHTDITEQKLAQEKLAYRTALLEAHNEASIDGILLVDAKARPGDPDGRGKILSFNQRFVEIWNMPQHIVNDKDDDAALSFAMSQLVNPQQFIDKVKYLYEHPTETSLDELVLKNGKIVERNGYSVIGEDGAYYAWSWTFKDITERKTIELDLKNIKEQLELTFKNIPAGVYLINAKAEMVYVNERGAAVYGDFTPEYMLEHKDLSTQLKIADELFERFDENGNYFSGQDSPAYISLTTGKPSQAILKQINKVTRQQRWYYVQGAPLFDEKGNVSLVLITSTDITEQKNAEEKIKYSEERFRSLAETLPQMVWVRNGDGEMEYASKNWKEYSGVDDVAEAWSYMIHPDDSEGLKVYWTQVFAEKKRFST